LAGGKGNEPSFRKDKYSALNKKSNRGKRRVINAGKFGVVEVAMLVLYVLIPHGPQAHMILLLLGANNLIAAALMLRSLAVLPLSRMGVGSLPKTLLVLASRCAIQVFLLGSVVLQQMMGTSQPIYVALWIFGVGLTAVKEAFSRI
jgi:hypothetical protein